MKLLKFLLIITSLFSFNSKIKTSDTYKDYSYKKDRFYELVYCHVYDEYGERTGRNYMDISDFTIENVGKNGFINFSVYCTFCLGRKNGTLELGYLNKDNEYVCVDVQEYIGGNMTHAETLEVTINEPVENLKQPQVEFYVKARLYYEDGSLYQRQDIKFPQIVYGSTIVLNNYDFIYYKFKYTSNSTNGFLYYNYFSCEWNTNIIYLKYFQINFSTMHYYNHFIPNFDGEIRFYFETKRFIDNVMIKDEEGNGYLQLTYYFDSQNYMRCKFKNKDLGGAYDLYLDPTTWKMSLTKDSTYYKKVNQVYLPKDKWNDGNYYFYSSKTIFYGVSECKVNIIMDEIYNFYELGSLEDYYGVSQSSNKVIDDGDGETINL